MLRGRRPLPLVVPDGGEAGDPAGVSAPSLSRDGTRFSGELASIPVPLEREWDALADRTGAAPFLRPGWIQAWWRAFGRGELEILTVSRAGRIVGLAPLYRRYGTVRSPSNWHTPWFGFLSEDAAIDRALAQMTLAGARRRATLSFLDAEGSTLAGCRAAGDAAAYRVVARTLERSPYLDIDHAWDVYEASLRRGFRRDLARRLRRLHEAGRVSFEMLDGAERLDELLAEGFAVEASSWPGSSGTAVAAGKKTRRFYGEVARWAANDGRLRLAFLRLDGRAVAFHFGLEEQGVYYPLKGAYDPRFAKFSPGSLMIHFTLSHAFSTGLRRYEFLGGDEPYKLAWTSSCRSVVLLHLCAPSPTGALDWLALAYGRPLAKAAHLTPVVMRFRR